MCVLPALYVHVADYYAYIHEKNSSFCCIILTEWDHFSDLNPANFNLVGT